MAGLIIDGGVFEEAVVGAAADKEHTTVLEKTVNVTCCTSVYAGGLLEITNFLLLLMLDVTV